MDPIRILEEVVNLLEQEIAVCNSQKDILQRELEDVLVKVDTLDTSDDEDIRQVGLHREQNQIVRLFKNAILTIDYQPTELCCFL